MLVVSVAFHPTLEVCAHSDENSFTEEADYDRPVEMSFFARLLLCLTTSLLLTNCGLIGTALRLAPLALMLAENEQPSQGQDAFSRRGRQIEQRGVFFPPAPAADARDSGLAAR